MTQPPPIPVAASASLPLGGSASLPSGPPASRARKPGLAPGDRLGRYYIVRQLATGGMAEIYLGTLSRVRGFQKLVVLKRILPALAVDDEYLEMFLNEARIAAGLHHPNIMQVFDIGLADQIPFMVMEYQNGRDVRALMRETVNLGRPMPMQHAIHIVTCVCAGLHSAHESVDAKGRLIGIVHRDVSPHNVVVTFDGHVKLVDFGVAKASNRTSQTRNGLFKGKLSYMSPEQGRADDIDRRSDIFATGILLYELTVGRRLFDGPGDCEVLRQVFDARIPPPTDLVPHYPPALERIVMRALERDRDRRYATADEMQAALEEYAREAGLDLSARALRAYMEASGGPVMPDWREAPVPSPDGRSDAGPSASDDTPDEDYPSVEVLHPEPPPAPAHAQGMASGGEAAIMLLATDVPPEAATRRSRLGVLGWGLAAAAALALVTGVALTCRELIRVHAFFAGGRTVATRPAWPTPKPPSPAQAAAAPGPVAAPAASASAPAATEPRLARAMLTVKTDPRHATLVLDGRKLESLTPTTLTDLDANRELVITAKLKGRKDATVHLTLLPGEQRTLGIKLARSDDAPSGQGGPQGDVVVATNPWCTISVDGKQRGTTPTVLTLPAGRHTLLLTSPDLKISREMPVYVQANASVRIKVDLMR